MDFIAHRVRAQRSARRYRLLFIPFALAGLPVLWLTIAVLLSFVTLALHTFISAMLDLDPNSLGLAPLRPIVALVPGSWRSFHETDVRVWAVIEIALALSLVAFSFHKLRRARQSSAAALYAVEIGAFELRGAELDLEERQLANIVGEMCVAAGMDTPAAFSWGEAPGLNAFSRGTGTGAEIYVSRGALEALNREETQALVAHEISRLMNDDQMAVLRSLASALLNYGSLRLARWILRPPHRGEATHWFFMACRWVIWLVYLPFGLVLWGAGSIQYLMAGIFWAAITRRQIAVADAFAVQFTRNPDALKSVLMKVAVHGGSVGGAEVGDENLENVCFASLTSRRWFDSHPSIETRLRAIDPGFRSTELDEVRERFAARSRLLELASDDAEAARVRRIQRAARFSNVEKTSKQFLQLDKEGDPKTPAIRALTDK